MVEEPLYWPHPQPGPVGSAPRPEAVASARAVISQAGLRARWYTGASGVYMDDQAKVSSICAECGAPVAFVAGAPQVRCDYCGAGLAISGDTVLVRLSCPSCHGNFCYLDGAMAGQCPYCDTPLLALTRHRLLRFVTPPKQGPGPPGAELCLLPFWRLSGVLFGWDIGQSRKVVKGDPRGQTERGDTTAGAGIVSKDPKKVFRGRVVERWLPDPITLSHGVTSLRLRAAVHPLESFEQHHEGLGRLHRPTLDVEAAEEGLYALAMGIGSGTDGLTLSCQRADIVAESISLLYYPFWVREQGGALEVWDAVSGDAEPVGRRQPAPEPRPSAVFDDLKLVEARCGSCGEPLTPANHGVVFPCHACDTFWVAEKEGLEPFSAGYARPLGAVDSTQKIIWLPFWQVQVGLQYRGDPARTVGDMQAVLGIHGHRDAERSSHSDAPLSYYTPAYGAMRGPRIDYAARDMTLWQPRLDAGEFAKGEVFHCFYGPDDARRLAYVAWLQILPGCVARWLKSLRVDPEQVQLWYVPFVDRGRELTNLLTGISYDRSAFRGVGH